MPSIARPTKGATCCCDDANPASRGPRRAGRRTPCRQLPPVPSPCLELPGRRAGGGAAASVRRRAQPARRVALGILVLVCGSRCRALLAGGGTGALYAAVGARLSGYDRDLRPVERAALLAGHPRAAPPPRGAACDRVSGRLDGGRVGRGPSGRYSVPLPRPGEPNISLMAHGPLDRRPG